MITLRVQVPYASFRKSYARSFAETYPLAPPATVYGMLLSLVGERFRARHAGVALAFAYASRPGLAFPGRPKIATTLRKLSRYKYGVANKQEKLGNAPDFIETLCDLDFLCWINSASERDPSGGGENLEARIERALWRPEEITRAGLVCLGLSDDAVDDIALLDRCPGQWHWLSPSEKGSIELPVWVDHVGSLYTRWWRFELSEDAQEMPKVPGPERFVQILDPRPPV